MYSKQMSSINVCTFNVKGLANKDKRTRVFEWLKTNNYSVCCLQELHCVKSDISVWQNQWKNQLFLSGNSSNSTGVGILLNINVDYNILQYQEIVEGRLQLLEIEINGNRFSIINVYAPNNNSLHFLNCVENLMIEQRCNSLIVCGDFNVVMDYSLDKLNGVANTNLPCSKKLNEIVAGNELTDVWRTLYPNNRKYTEYQSIVV